ncbi:hypothetical protein CYMTET_14127 [Cymbomonas tetramitiformis]|uniref:Uncharacterized protein n=1 Tax=Cymbomonas tetramitiformis TaxID=36881 RepID=A0AAE0GI44_9CHLO|nr:hypothetical protein CYMTET_14127 [Cymbomonas tetramitiformis]
MDASIGITFAAMQEKTWAYPENKGTCWIHDGRFVGWGTVPTINYKHHDYLFPGGITTEMMKLPDLPDAYSYVNNLLQKDKQLQHHKQHSCVSQACNDGKDAYEFIAAGRKISPGTSEVIAVTLMKAARFRSEFQYVPGKCMQCTSTPILL